MLQYFSRVVHDDGLAVRESFSSSSVEASSAQVSSSGEASSAQEPFFSVSGEASSAKTKRKRDSSAFHPESYYYLYILQRTSGRATSTALGFFFLIFACISYWECHVRAGVLCYGCDSFEAAL